MKFLKNTPLLKERRRELREAETDAERLLWSKIRNRQLMGKKFCRQYSVGSYILDFYCSECCLALELDGSGHLESVQQVYDVERTHFLAQHGIRVLRFWNYEVVTNMNSVLSRISEEINSPRPSLTGQERALI